MHKKIGNYPELSLKDARALLKKTVEELAPTIDPNAITFGQLYDECFLFKSSQVKDLKNLNHKFSEPATDVP